MKTVSIIVPIYQVEKYIEQCLDSLLNQTYPAIEYILIDDCGTDQSVSIAKQIIEKHPRKNQVKWIHQQKNQGQSAARNEGVALSAGDYLFFVDSDDYITPDCLEIHMKYMEKYQPDLTIGGRVDGNIQKNFLKVEQVYEGFLNNLWNFSPWNKLIDKNFYITHHLTFEKGIIYEDHLWNFYLALSAKSIYIFPEKTYYYIIHDKSSSHAHPTQFNSYSWTKVMSDMYVVCKEKNLTDRATIIAMELWKFRKMDDLIHDYPLWKHYQKILKIKFAPTRKLLAGAYGSKLQKRAFLSILPYILYKPFAALYLHVGRKVQNSL